MNGQPITRRICPVEVRELQRLVTNSRMYLVRQVGPISWDIADDNRQGSNDSNSNTNGINQLATVRVSLGAVHKCTCLIFNRTKELCRHLVWLLLMKFKLRTSDQLSYQLGMTEAQLSRCLEGRPRDIMSLRKTRVNSGSKPARGRIVPKRPISGRDSCPICLESFANKAVIYCKYSCGNAMHTHCMDIVSKHQDLSQSSSGPEVGISCPLCRGYFCTQYELQLELRKPASIIQPQLRKLPTFQLECVQCDTAPITGAVYKCAACPQMIICPTCLKSQAFSVHAPHGLLVRTDLKMKWKKTQFPERKQEIIGRKPSLKSNRLFLPKLNKMKNNRIKMNSIPSDVSSSNPETTLQCPICTNHSMNVVELECGHVIPSPEPLIPPSEPVQPQKSPRPVTGRWMRSPPQPILPPPQVVVTRAELYARNKPSQNLRGLPYSQKMSTSSVKGSRKKLPNDRKSSELPEEDEEEYSIS